MALKLNVICVLQCVFTPLVYIAYMFGCQDHYCALAGLLCKGTAITHCNEKYLCDVGKTYFYTLISHLFVWIPHVSTGVTEIFTLLALGDY